MPARSGAEADVPSICISSPPLNIENLLPSMDTSGYALPFGLKPPIGRGAFKVEKYSCTALVCHDGRENKSLKPPPVVMELLSCLDEHTTSGWLTSGPIVAPTLVTNGDEVKNSAL